MENAELYRKMEYLESLVESLDEEVLSLQRSLDLTISQLPRTCELCINGPEQCDYYEECLCFEDTSFCRNWEWVSFFA